MSLPAFFDVDFIILPLYRKHYFHWSVFNFMFLYVNASSHISVGREILLRQKAMMRDLLLLNDLAFHDIIADSVAIY